MTTVIQNLKVGERGTITLPKCVRERLGIEPGMVLASEIVDGSVVLRPLPQPELTASEQDRLLDMANEGYSKLRADEKAWTEHQQELEEWDTTLPDGLSDD